MSIVTLIANAIRFGTAFLFGSTGEILTEKSGHLNLGIPGVMCVGAFGGCYGLSIYIGAVGLENIKPVPAILILASVLIWGSLELLLEKKNLEFKWSQSKYSFRAYYITLKQ